MMRGTAGMRLVMGILSPVFLLLCVVAIYSEETRPWVSFQEQFAELYRAKATAKLQDAKAHNDAAETAHWQRVLDDVSHVKPALAQVYLEDAKIADRCTTCHQGIDNPLFQDAPQPFRTHPGKLLQQHDPTRFGCTLCHQGQGAATTVEGAHGLEPNWLTPMLPKAYVQAGCARCHGVVHDLPGAEQVRAGTDLFLERGCYGCHDVPGFSYLPKYGPPLSALPAKLADVRGFVYAWVNDPSKVHPDTAMPTFQFNPKEKELEQIAAFIVSLPPPAKTAPPINLEGASADEGERLFTERGCRGCHGVKPDEHSVARRVPHLVGIGSKVKAEWLDQWIADPKAYNPDTAMPKVELTDDERHNVVKYLMTLTRTEPLPPAPDLAPYSVEEGKKFVQRYECFGCHVIPGFEKTRPSVPSLAEFARKPTDELDFGRTDVPRTKWNWLDHKLQEPRSYEWGKVELRMPKSPLNEAERAQVITCVLSLDAPTLPAHYLVKATEAGQARREQAWMVAHLNCNGCHRLDERDPHIAGYFERKNMVPPSLVGVGARLQGGYMYQFLLEPKQVRPWLKIRMPKFGFTEPNARTLVAGFAAASTVANPYTYVAKENIDQAHFQRGIKRFRHYKCVQCHPTSVDQGLPEGVDPEDLSINLMLSKTRLRPEWIRDFLERPKQIAGAQTRMPTVFYTVDGVPKVEKPKEDIDDITTYLMGMTEPPEVTLKAEEETKKAEDEQKKAVDWSNMQY